MANLVKSQEAKEVNVYLDIKTVNIVGNDRAKQRRRTTHLDTGLVQMQPSISDGEDTDARTFHGLDGLSQSRACSDLWCRIFRSDELFFDRQALPL